MEQLPDGQLEDWLPLVYDDVPTSIWPVAMRSLMAHVAHLKA
jgi:recombination protein RecT